MQTSRSKVKASRVTGQYQPGTRHYSFFSSGASIHKPRTSLSRLLSTAAFAIAMVVPSSVSSAYVGQQRVPIPAAIDNSQALAQVLPATGGAAHSQVFSVTGKVVQGDFLKTFGRFGLDRIGYPLSDEMQEGGRTVQYFERVRMEYHPELANKGYSVLLTRLGSDLTQNDQFSKVPPFNSTAARAYMSQTGHSLSGPFLSYWASNGGVELFGYPISEPVAQDGLTVQWFERARFEYHPELAKTGHTIELSLLGKTVYDKEFGQQSQPAQAQLVSQQTTNQKAAPASPLPMGTPRQESMESYILQAINQQRASAGLQPVQVNAAVVGLARARSADMATRNYFSHTTPEGTNFLSMLVERGVSYKFGGEILARNNFPDDQGAQVAMTSYLNSPPHKAIILDGRYGQVGVGYAKSSDGMHYFTVIFIQQ